jgi:hypothetical protein
MACLLRGQKIKSVFRFLFFGWSQSWLALAGRHGRFSFLYDIAVLQLIFNKTKKTAEAEGEQIRVLAAAGRP